MKATDLLIIGGAVVAVCGAIYLLKQHAPQTASGNPDPTQNPPYAMPYWGSINN